MRPTPQHIQWLTDSTTPITTNDGRTVEVWQLNHVDDAAVFADWAAHFRSQYCSLEEIDDLRVGTGCSRSDYLKKLRFPAKDTALGPSIRAGDFAEILLADFLQYTQHFWVPRTRYNLKAVRDESTKGSDLVGFRYKNGPDQASTEDLLVVFESKTQLSGDRPSARLNDAIKDSEKDAIRLGESLNAIKQRLRLEGNGEWVQISRFQNQEDQPYTRSYGAAAVLSTAVFDEELIRTSTTQPHPEGKALRLLIIHGTEMMTLVHTLYDLACDCDDS